VRQWGFRANNDPVLVLDAKGGEIKAKASKWISYHLRILKIVELEPLFVKILLLSLVGRMFDYGKKGEFFESLINFSWNISLYASTSVFDLEIGN
jgi:hypothetical protein